MNDFNRRKFLATSGLAAVALTTWNTPAYSSSTSAATLNLGLASYSLRKFSQSDAILMAKRAGLTHMCFKSMHLPLDAPTSELQSAPKKLADVGMTLYAGGVIYMKSKAEVDQAFAYAKNAGMPMIIGVPNHDLLEYTNEKIKRTGIRVAIHNHGPGDEVYPSPGSVYEKIKNLDPRFGLCMDIGHTQRIGLDPAKEAEKYFDRLFDIHIKDVSSSTPEGDTVEIGRGVIDIPAFLKVLVTKGYKGVVAFEYEKDENDPMPGLCESVGYVKGCLRMMGKG
jgi:sugar phosphate isomerase/epimerase